MEPIEKFQNEMSQFPEVCSSCVSNQEKKITKDVKTTNANMRPKVSNDALEQIANELKVVLAGVKDNMRCYRASEDSYSDVLPVLENMIQNHMKRIEQNAKPHEFEDEEQIEVCIQVPDLSQARKKIVKKNCAQRGAAKNNRPGTSSTCSSDNNQRSEDVRRRPSSSTSGVLKCIKNMLWNAPSILSNAIVKRDSGKSTGKNAVNAFKKSSSSTLPKDNMKQTSSRRHNNNRTNCQIASNVMEMKTSSKLENDTKNRNYSQSKGNKTNTAPGSNVSFRRSNSPTPSNPPVSGKRENVSGGSRPSTAGTAGKRNSSRPNSPLVLTKKNASNSEQPSISRRGSPSSLFKDDNQSSSPTSSSYPISAKKNIVGSAPLESTRSSKKNVVNSARPSSARSNSPVILNKRGTLSTSNFEKKGASSYQFERANSQIQNYTGGSIYTASSFPRTASQPKRLGMARINRKVYNPLASYKEEVDAAIKAKKTFAIKGSFGAIRRALLRRGWVEKISTVYKDLTTTEMRTLAQKSVLELLEMVRLKHRSCDLCKRLIKSKLLVNHQVDLYWGYSYNGYKDCPDKNKLTLMNRIRWTSTTYTNKIGLSEQSKKAFWYHIPDVANLNHPRSYRLVKDGDAEEFVNDFNLTAAMSLLKWVKASSENPRCKILSASGKVPVKIFDFAVNECYKFIKKATHEDIDHEISDSLSMEWNHFLEYFYKTVHIGNHFKQERNMKETDLVRRATFILTKLKDYWPYLEMDGMMNIWILKPTCSSRGLGIHMCRTLNYVLDTVKANPNRKYIIQKYIERPMLIYNTKFDIRQWFLISSASPLTIWVYKTCYLRFSSQTYNLRKLHESIHLTNNSVQCKYQNNTRDLNLPSFNMWDSYQFKNYLSNIGYPKAFNEIIYPGMKQCITAAVLMHYENMDTRKNCFELYGADFMLTEDFRPWLLEINSNPALFASTPITARLCPRVLEDVIKVVVDHARNQAAGTGGFELFYKGIETNCKQKELKVTGTHLKLQEYQEPPVRKKESRVKKKKSQSTGKDSFSEIGVGMKKTLEELLELIQKERERRESKLLRHKEVNGTTTQFDNRAVAEVAIQS